MIYSHKPKDKTRIVVAMSGGVDSSTVASMLHHEGYEVVGVTLQLYDQGKVMARKGACCAGQDIYDAKMVADKLGIAHYVLDYESKFKEKVIDDFVDTYLRGETPLPCVRCNQSVKFHDLLKLSRELGADALATGHYVRKIKGKDGFELHSGIDPQKDQSYFLFTTTQEQLDYLTFPIGSFTKEETRNLARKFELSLADKPDSQDICFVSDGNYRNLVQKLKPASSEKGKIMHIDGYEMGQHDGIINYTIGQRRGLGISAKDPLYVVRIDPEKNIVYVGLEESLKATEFTIKDVNWIGKDFAEEMEVQVKIRSARPPAFAKIKKMNCNNMKVKLLSPEKAITPGQACVIYDKQRLLGGGWISKELVC